MPPDAPTATQASNRFTAAAALLQKRIVAARTDFSAFVKYIWSNTPGFEIADFHLEAIAAYTNADLKFVYWEAPRGHAKSLITMAFVVWCLGQDVNHRIKILCANDKEARKRLAEVKAQIEKNPLLKLVFPRLKKEGATEWNKQSILLERDLQLKDPTIEAMGIMSGSLGSRATLIVCDDIVDMRNSILQPELKKHVQQKLFAEIVPLLEPEGRLLAVGTPWTLSDVNALMKESDGFYTVGPHRVGDGEDKFAPIWEYKMPREMLMKMHEVLGPAEYTRAYLCKALTGDTVPIQAQWIKFYDEKLLGDPYEHQCFTIYDLAIEQSSKNDYFANVTLLWDQERNYVFVVDAWMDRISFRKQAKAVTDGAAKWQPNEVVIEHGGYQGALASYLSETAKKLLPIWPFRTRGRSKERRVTEASPWFERGRVFFHPKFNPLKNPDIVHTAPIISQLTTFPFDKFDDLVDALVMGILVITDLAPVIDDSGDEGFEHDGQGIAMRMTVV